MPELLQITALKKRFGPTVALAGVDLQLSEGEILGLLGPNGAGKSTLVRAIVGRVQPDGGTVQTSSHSAGWVPQEISLYPLLTVEENLLIFGRYFGLQGDELAESARRAMEWAGLVERSDERTANLSGGMKRRLNMAAGVVHRPRLVLMDEPTVGVDPQSREKIYSMIEGMRDEGVGVIYTTHYMEEAERLCDRIAVIDHGRIIAEGTREELIASIAGTRREAHVELGRELSPQAGESLRAKGAAIEGLSLIGPIENAGSALTALVRDLESAGAEVRDLSLHAPSLENVFLHLTGRELRE